MVKNKEHSEMVRHINRLENRIGMLIRSLDGVVMTNKLMIDFMNNMKVQEKKRDKSKKGNRKHSR